MMKRAKMWDTQQGFVQMLFSPRRKQNVQPYSLLPAVIAIVLLVVSGCATVAPQGQDESARCETLWQSMETVIARENVRDGYAPIVDGFNYLRADRFLVSLAQQVHSEKQERALLTKMRELDLKRRYLELEFLSDTAWNDLSQKTLVVDEGLFKRQVAQCSAEFLQKDRRDTHYFARVMESVDVDQDYSSLYRALGLYPLTQCYVSHLVQVYEEEHPVIVGDVVLPQAHRIGPEPGRKVSVKRIGRMMRNNRLTPFLDFQFPEQKVMDLVRHYGPVFSLAGNSFGRIVHDGSGWQVDERDPVVYYYLSHALIQDVPALQINYVIWFNNRSEPAPWYTTGHLDGITVRVTLDWQGEPLVYDSIGNCGCFYFAVLNDALVEENKEIGAGFLPRISGALPKLQPRQHLSVAVAQGSNAVVGINAEEPRKDLAQYRFLPYAQLERFSGVMPVKFFDESGYVEDTDRFESYFLFPMGIPNVGAMRQRGRQPVTLVGRAYFDDPYLLENSITLKSDLPARGKLVKKKSSRPSNLKRRVESSKAMGKTGRKSRTDKYLKSEERRP